MRVSDIILLGIAVVLTVYLHVRLWRRARAPLPETHWTGHGIDVSPVSKRVERARSDFASELRARPHDTCRQKDLLASARTTVGQFSYFRRRDRQNSSQAEHGEE